jgi:hypothetical protein
MQKRGDYLFFADPGPAREIEDIDAVKLGVQAGLDEALDRRDGVRIRRLAQYLEKCL